MNRPLTQGEIALARSIFAHHINYHKVQLKTAWWVLRGYAVAPNGNIYFNKADWVMDFATETLAKQAWFIHELTHVWQSQNGMAVFWCALLNRRYGYLKNGVFIEGKTFYQYGIEQQARMVEDYFVRKQTQQDCTAWQKCIVFLQEST